MRYFLISFPNVSRTKYGVQQDVRKTVTMRKKVCACDFLRCYFIRIKSNKFNHSWNVSLQLLFSQGSRGHLDACFPLLPQTNTPKLRQTTTVWTNTPLLITQKPYIWDQYFCNLRTKWPSIIQNNCTQTTSNTWAVITGDTSTQNIWIAELLKELAELLAYICNLGFPRLLMSLPPSPWLIEGTLFGSGVWQLTVVPWTAAGVSESLKTQLYASPSDRLGKPGTSRTIWTEHGIKI